MTLRTIELPTAPAVFWDDFAWPAKSPADELHYTLDATKWLVDAGETIASVTVSASPGLVFADVDWSTGQTVVLQLSSGVPGTTATVVLTLVLSNQDVLTVTIALRVSAAVPAGLVPAWPPTNGPPNTADGTTVTADSTAHTADAG